LIKYGNSKCFIFSSVVALHITKQGGEAELFKLN